MKRILIVEGNLREENQSFTDGGIKTHTESLKDSISYFTDQLDIDVVNPSSDENINEVAMPPLISFGNARRTYLIFCFLLNFKLFKISMSVFFFIY